ncbi:MAG: hypothetical protein AAF297_10490 [Planctomycetota bacterium]
MSTSDTAAIRDYCEALAEPEGMLFPAAPAATDPLVHELLVSMLVWNASPTQAAAALSRLLDDVVDENELRVCFADDIASLLGPRFPVVEERAERLLRVLNAVYRNEHAMSLDALRDANKRDARTYLDALDGIVPFAAARVFLVGLGGHAFPLDDRMTTMLIDDGVLEDDCDAASASARFERAFRAGEAEPAYRKLEAALNSKSPRPTGGRRKKAAATKTKRSSAKA